MGVLTLCTFLSSNAVLGSLRLNAKTLVISAHKPAGLNQEHKDVLVFFMSSIVNVKKCNLASNRHNYGSLPRWHLEKRYSLLLLIGSDSLVSAVS